MPTCRACGTVLDEGEQFCYKCGAKYEQQSFCSQCGSRLREDAAFCASCGTSCIGSKATNRIQNAVSDKWAWTLATAPLCVDIVFGSWAITGILLRIIVIALNCTFLILDKKELESNGNKPGDWIWLGLVLVPVYLFMRASKMGGKYGYAITWCGLFLLSLFV